MFSTNQIEIIETLVPTMISKGYSHYVAYTNTSTDGSWNSTPIVDLYIVFSSEEITATDLYSYSVPAGSVRYAIRTGNYSTSTNAVNTERYEVTEFSGTLSVDVYEHIYTNAQFGTATAVQPDILQEGRVNTLYDQGNMFILAALLIFIVIAKMWTFRK